MSATTLDAVEWPRVFRELFESLDELPGYPEFYTRPHGLLSRLHVLLAVVAVQAGRERCQASAAGSQVGGWLYDAARTAHRMLTLDPEPQWACPTFTGYLRVDPQLPVQPLPLLGLAAEHAEAVRRPLIIEPGEHLGPTTAGRTWRNTTADIGGETRTVDVVELHARDAATWLHELSHVVDPHFEQRDPVAQEAFADTLGTMLGATPPATLPVLHELIHAAELIIASEPTPATESPQEIQSLTSDQQVSAATAGGLPAPGVESIYAFAALPISIDALTG